MHFFIVCKVQLLCEGHKNVRNRPYGFEIYLVNVKTIRTISQIFCGLLRKAELYEKEQIVKRLKINVCHFKLLIPMNYTAKRI